MTHSSLCSANLLYSDYCLHYIIIFVNIPGANADEIHILYFYKVSALGSLLEYRLYGVIQDVVFTHQPHFSCSFLSLICLSTNQNIQLIHSLLIRIEWTTGNAILMSSSHWPIYNKFPPDIDFLSASVVNDPMAV